METPKRYHSDMDVDSKNPRIVRLAPLDAVLALIEARVGAVLPRQDAPAPNRTLAADVVAARPAHGVALRDGIAVDAAAIADASSYAPAPLTGVARRVDAGDPLPQGADAILPLDAVTLRGDGAEAATAVSPGEGVLPAGGDAMPATPLRRSRQQLRAIDRAALAAAGVAKVLVRVPRVRIAIGGAAATPPIRAALEYLAYALITAGADETDAIGDCGSLEDALAATNADSVIAVGGTGSGRRDSAVHTLARFGRIEAHGIAIAPGETAAFGFVGAMPVLLVPGRLDAALAVWLLLGRHLVAKLAGGRVDDAPAMLPLKRKITSAIGLAELVPVAHAEGMAEPLGSGYLSLTALAQSDGWIVVPADSEGFPAGAEVAVTPWP
jgi:molybdopterin molybdotransferase